MARMPGAAFRPVVNVHKNGVRERRGLVLHVQDDTGNPYGWFNTPSSEASSDFWVRTDGHIEQYVETGTDYAWAQADGNPYYASVETEGHPDTPLTAAQVEAVAHIYAWGHAVFGWPLVVVDSTSEHGLTWHGVGGASWGGHTGCPGDKRKGQRAAIIARAKELAAPAPSVPGGGSTPSVSLSRLISAARTDPDADQGHQTYAAGVRLVEAALHAEGLLSGYYSDGSYGSRTVTAYAAWQRRLNFHGDDADGIPGRTSLTALGKRHGFTVA